MGKSAILTILFLLLLGGVFSLLYRNGHLTVCTKKAVLFCGTYRRASVSSCSAVLRRVIRFREGGLHFIILRWTRRCKEANGRFVFSMPNSLPLCWIPCIRQPALTQKKDGGICWSSRCAAPPDGILSHGTEKERASKKRTGSPSFEALSKFFIKPSLQFSSA